MVGFPFVNLRIQGLDQSEHLVKRQLLFAGA
jgi:hypothetical protein